MQGGFSPSLIVCFKWLQILPVGKPHCFPMAVLWNVTANWDTNVLLDSPSSPQQLHTRQPVFYNNFMWEYVTFPNYVSILTEPYFNIPLTIKNLIVWQNVEEREFRKWLKGINHNTKLFPGVLIFSSQRNSHSLHSCHQQPGHCHAVLVNGSCLASEFAILVPTLLGSEPWPPRPAKHAQHGEPMPETLTPQSQCSGGTPFGEHWVGTPLRKQEDRPTKRN